MLFARITRGYTSSALLVIFFGFDQGKGPHKCGAGALAREMPGTEAS